jgi:uncharacterized protein
MEKEVFIVENGTCTVLFAPLRGLIMEVNEKEKGAIIQLLERPTFSFENLFVAFPELEPKRLLNPPVEPITEPETQFSPTGVSLFTTFDCHLRCVYCYANAGNKKTNMDIEIADAVINFIIANAKRKGSQEVSLEFHGGGEPTFNWKVFQYTLLRFNHEALENGLSPKLGLATNGMLTQTQINWIAKHFAEVQISLDGIEEIQNVQRPTAAYGESFAIVSQSVRALLAKDIKLVLHSVVTKRGIERLPEIIQFFGENFPKVTVHMEPAFPCGRGLATGEQFPSPMRFVERFLEAYKIAESFGISLIYSGAAPQLTVRNLNFCGVSNPNFVVTPNGLVTACHEVAESTHPFKDLFIYGYFDRKKRKFIFDYEKIDRLRKFAKNSDPVCSQCFAHFYCASDCLVKRIDAQGTTHSPISNPRCTINQALMKGFIFNQFIDGRKESHDEYTTRAC